MVYPIDSEDALPGTIKYISSGTLIGYDKTIQMQQILLLNGKRAIISLDHGMQETKGEQSCETSRKAVVIIHNRLQPTGGSWLSSLLGLESSKIDHKISTLFGAPVASSSGKS